jgi:site-specific DNA-adenine methylase
MTSYHGGKYRHGNEIARVIKDIYDKQAPNSIVGYIEPFCGMCGVYRHVVNLLPKKLKYIASDQHDSLILMWKALQEGWTPPKSCDAIKFDKLKHSEPSPEKAYIGFGTSFGGIYYSGHKTKYNTSICDNSSKIKIYASDMKHVKFFKRDFTYYKPDKYNKYIIYCDPPYEQTDNSHYYDDKTHKHLSFDNNKFWIWCRQMSKENIVIVSEFSAPLDFISVYEFDSKRFSALNVDTKTEHLYIHKSLLK